MADLHEELENKKVVQKRFITNDATVEKLAQLMVDNPQGLLLLRDELFGWLRTFNKAGREGDREFYLESWNGTGSFTIDRISRGTLHVKSMCLSVLGGVQPGKLNSHIRSMKEGGNADDGFMQRFQLIVYPDLPENWENIDREPCETSWQKTGDLFNHIYKVRQNENVSLRFDDLALKRFVEWRLSLEKRLRSNTIDSPHFESHIAKYRSLIPSLALIFEVANNPQSLHSVSLNSLSLALKWGDFLEQHVKKIYQIDATDEINGAKALAIKILSRKINDKEKIRIIWRRKWTDLNTSDKLDQACQYLEDLNWVRIETIKTRGRSSSILRINPKIYQKEYHQNLCKSVGIITSSNRREGPLD